MLAFHALIMLLGFLMNKSAGGTGVSTFGMAGREGRPNNSQQPVARPPRGQSETFPQERDRQGHAARQDQHYQAMHDRNRRVDDRCTGETCRCPPRPPRPNVDDSCDLCGRWLRLPVDRDTASALKMMAKSQFSEVGSRRGRRSIGGDVIVRGERVFHVHFDGADGKCQVQQLLVSRCRVLRQWRQPVV